MINFIFQLGWILLGENVKCKDNDGLRIGYVPSLEECAIQCMGVSKWFIYAKSDNGNDKCQKLQGCCSSEGCQCYAEETEEYRGKGDLESRLDILESRMARVGSFFLGICGTMENIGSNNEFSNFWKHELHCCVNSEDNKMACLSRYHNDDSTDSIMGLDTFRVGSCDVSDTNDSLCRNDKSEIDLNSMDLEFRVTILEEKVINVGYSFESICNVLVSLNIPDQWQCCVNRNASKLHCSLDDNLKESEITSNAERICDVSNKTPSCEGNISYVSSISQNLSRTL